MQVFGLTGKSGSGKTTLLCALLPRLRAAGLSISTIKHGHKRVDLDTPGKDSWRHRTAGAAESVLATPGGYAIFADYSDTEAPDLDDLLARLRPVDLVLVEGFKGAGAARLEVFRPSLGEPPLFPDHAAIAAVATDSPDMVRAMAKRPISVFALDDLDGILAFILADIGYREPVQEARGQRKPA